jgi:hypothetical protein
MRIRQIAALAAVVLTAACAAPAAQGRAAAVPVPSRAVFTGLALRDPSVMQSFAYDPAHKTWIFAQLTWGKPASAGDLTLTRVSASGARLGWMHLAGFGHGLSIGAEPCGASTCVWAEVHAVAEPALGWALAGAYGNQVARFAWRNGATIAWDSAGVERFGVNANAPEQTPSVDAADGLIGVQYWSAGLRVFRWAVYSLAAFKQHRYTALARFTVPRALGGGVEQGWALASRSQVGNWQGTAGGAATFSTVSTAGVLTSRVTSTAGAGLSYREPEGMARAGPGNLCTGFASGAAGARRANVYCQARPLHRDDHQPPVRPRSGTAR